MNPIGPIITDFISTKCTYSIPGERSSGNWIESTSCPDKRYTYVIMFTAANAVLALICTFSLENKFAVCVKGKKVNEEYSYEEEKGEEENIDANETTTLIN